MRFELGASRRVLGGGLIVERGQAAVLSVGGAAAVTLQPGPYRFDEEMLRDLASIGGRIDMAFVNTADIDLRFNFSDLMSRDHLPVSGEGLLVVRVARPAQFLAGVVRSRVRFTEWDLCRSLSGAVLDALADFAGRMSAFDLDSGLETKRKLQAVLEHHLGAVLDGQGLEFVALRSVRFRQEGVMRERRALGEVLLAERQLEIMKRRAATAERMSELEAQLAAARARTEQQVADLRRSLEGRALDQELVRRQMREKMELEHRLELARLRAQMPPEERAAAFPEMGFKQAAAAYARFAGTGPDRS